MPANRDTGEGGVGSAEAGRDALLPGFSPWKREENKGSTVCSCLAGTLLSKDLGFIVPGDGYRAAQQEQAPRAVSGQSFRKHRDKVSSQHKSAGLVSTRRERFF